MIRGWQRRKAVQALAQDGSAEAIHMLAEAAARSDDEEVRALALESLRQVTSQAGIDAVCSVWFTTRNSSLTGLLTDSGWIASAPVELRIFSALKVWRLEEVAEGGEDIIDPLLRACADADPEIARRARHCLVNLKNHAAIDLLVQRWAENRVALLEQAILQGGYIAREPLKARVLSALRLNQPSQIDGYGAEVVEPLLLACQDSDPTIAAVAHQCLLSLQNPDAIDRLCYWWSQTRHTLLDQIVTRAGYIARAPVDARVLTALKHQQRELITGLGKEVLPPLFAAYSDADSAIAQQAILALGELTNPEARAQLADQVGPYWTETRQPALEEMIVRGRYVASQPVKAQVYTALKVGEWQPLLQLGKEVVEPLLAARADADTQIAAAAGDCLAALQNQEAIDELCRHWAESRPPVIEQLIKQQSYVAQQPAGVHVLSALKTRQREQIIDNLTHDAIAPLMAACNDGDEEIAEQAHITVARLTKAEGDLHDRFVQYLCEAWSATRMPLMEGLIVRERYIASQPSLARVLSALKVERLDAIAGDGTEVIHPLLAACDDSDPEIAQRARDGLAKLENADAVDLLCRIWYEKRNPTIEQAIVQGTYIARQPVEAQVYTALKTGNHDRLPASGSAVAEALLQAKDDADSQIAEQARIALAAMSDPDARALIAGRIGAGWAETRDPVLEQIVVRGGYIPEQPFSARVLAALKTGQRSLLTGLDEQVFEPLLHASADSDELIAAEAEQALHELDHPQAQSALAAAWMEQRSPLLESSLMQNRIVPEEPPALRTLCALKTGRRDLLLDEDAAIVGLLLAACDDADTEIVKEAKFALGELRHPEARIAAGNRLCAMWVESRAPDLQNIILSGKYIAAEPLKTRVLSALLTAQPEAIIGLGAEVVEPLLDATKDRDEIIARMAWVAIHELTNPEAQAALDKLCTSWALTRMPALEDIIVRGRYTARNPIAVRVLSALKIEERQIALDAGIDAVMPLVAALQDTDPVIAEQASLALEEISDPVMRDAVAAELCTHWVATRTPALEQVLIRECYVSGNPFEVRVLSALKTRQRNLLLESGTEIVKPLLVAMSDRDPVIAEQARLVAIELQQPEARLALAGPLCAAWATTRSGELAEVIARGKYIAQHPPEVRVLSALQANQPEALGNDGAEIVMPLLQACEDGDATIAERALQSLYLVRNPETIDALCKQWVETRLPLLDRLILQQKYVANRPLNVRLLTALKTEQIDTLGELDREYAECLVAAINDPDPAIAHEARQAAGKLTNPEARSTMASYVGPAWAESRDPDLEEVLLRGQYVPEYPLAARILAALKTRRRSLLTGVGSDGVGLLLQACEESDPVIVEEAKQSLDELEQPQAQAALASAWAQTRSPLLEGCLVRRRLVPEQPLALRTLCALKTEQRHLLIDHGAEMVDLLLKYTGDADHDITQQAQLALGELTNPQARQELANRLCPKWAATRHADMEDIIVRGKYVTQQPPEVRVLSALKTEQIDLLVDNGPEILSPLLAACEDGDPAIVQQAHQCLYAIRNPETIDELCRLWVETGSPLLEQLIMHRKPVASQPPAIRVLTALKTEQRDAITGAGIDVIGLLEQARKHTDSTIAEQARLALGELTNPQTRDAFAARICERWATARPLDLEDLIERGRYVAAAPPVVRVLSALKTRRRDLITNMGSEVVELLMLAREDPDRTIGEQAQIALGELSHPDARDKVSRLLCGRWMQTRAQDLEDIIVRGSYVVDYPLDVCILTSLKTRQITPLLDQGAEIVNPLIAAADDADPMIAAQARLALRQLRNEGAREAVCNLVVEQNSAIAREAVLEGRYAPENSYLRALFFFLTEQWSRYDELDGDRRLLNSYYETAPPATKQRIAEKLRIAGRSDFLPILTKENISANIARLKEPETELALQILTVNHEWDRLWALVFDLPVKFGIATVRTLAGQSWQPEALEERELFKELADLANTDMVDTADEIYSMLPPAIERQCIELGDGQVKAVTFAPTRPVIAATIDRRAVLWNYREATPEITLDNFTYPLGRPIFTADGTLVCAEQSEKLKDTSGLYVWKPGDSTRRKVWKDSGPITTIEPVTGTRILCTVRNQTAYMFDIESGKALRHMNLAGTWIRAMRVSEDGRFAALLHEGISVVRMPEMLLVGRANWQRSVMHAAFAPNDNKYKMPQLIAGDLEGEVVICHSYSLQYTDPFCKHSSPIQGVEILPDRLVVISASSDGWIQFTEFPNGTPLHRFRIPCEKLTSMTVSPDGSFMATSTIESDGKAIVSIWDLRTALIPSLFARPLAGATPLHLVAVDAVVDRQAFHPRMRRALQFVYGILKHRYTYDSRLAEVPYIKQGTFTADK